MASDKTNRELIKVDAAVGMTIESVIASRGGDAILLALSGDNFAIIKAEPGYDDDADIDSDAEFYRHDYNQEDLARVFNDETIHEWSALKEAQMLRNAEACEKADRQKYEALKAKFEKQ